MKKYKIEIILFIVNAIYMILELIASRVLSPYFGSSNIIWTSVIGIILLSTSTGNFIGGKIADKSEGKDSDLKSKINMILLFIGALIFIIPLIQKSFIQGIVYVIKDLKIGAIISTIILFFIPAMFIGMLSPIIIKLKMNNIEKAGQISGNIYALATFGSIVGTFLGGFVLVPNFGSNQILFVLSMIIFLLNLMLYNKENLKKIVACILVGLSLNILGFSYYSRVNATNGEKVSNGENGVKVEYDTQYGKVNIYNSIYKGNHTRHLNIDKGNESATFTDENRCYELVYEYTKYYDLMFKSSREIKDTLMIGGAGYSYPKYYISHYLDKKMDVVEIDGKVTDLAKKYFFLDKLINEFDLENNTRMNLITQDGRVYLNSNGNKYDAILNDAFSGDTPSKTLTTKEAAQKIHNSLNKNGIYLTNVISSIEGAKSKFIKAEVKTLKEVFKNVYVVPCNNRDNFEEIQNNMVVATDETIDFENAVNIETKEAVILTDNYCPVEALIPEI